MGERERTLVVTRGDRKTPGGNVFDAAGPSWALTGKACSWEVLHTNRGQNEHGERQTRGTTAPAPAPALTAKAGGQWAFSRPATTVCADARVGASGHRDRAGGERQFDGDAIRLTVRDALVLQSFRPDYPVQGTKTKQFEQIGNANVACTRGCDLGAVLVMSVGEQILAAYGRLDELLSVGCAECGHGWAVHKIIRWESPDYQCIRCTPKRRWHRFIDPPAELKFEGEVSA